MKAERLTVILAVTLPLLGCVSAIPSPETATRAEPFGRATTATQIAAEPIDTSFRVVDVRVVVPDTLSVSEANSLYPVADIVWRGDPMGDRRAQVAAILEEAFTAGTESLDGPVPVIVTLTLRRFHSLTDRTRYTVGGVHSIRFDLALKDARTGAILDGPRFVIADLGALGGAAAIEAEEAGQGQKVRILQHLTALAARELGSTAIAASR